MRKIALNDICQLEKGKRIDTEQLSDNNLYKYINGGIKESGYYNDYNTEGNTIIISEGGASCGYVNYIDEPFWCGCHCYRLTNSSVNPKYLYFAIKAQQESIMLLRTGSAMPNIKKSTLAEFEISIDENIQNQLEVVRKMETVDRLIQYRKEQLLQLDELIKARFVEMFGEPKQNPYHYEKKPLKKTCLVITGNTPSRAVSEYYGNYVEWIKTDNIVSGRLNPTAASEYLSEKGMKYGRVVDEGSILMACIAGSISSIGRVCITNRLVAFNQQINAIVPQDYNILFLYVLLQISKDYLTEDINMALKGILSKSKLEDKTFIVPPMNMQLKFSKFVEKFEKNKFIIQNSLKELETLKKALMQKYFG